MTRCPLVLQLIHKKEGDVYAVFDHQKGKKITDFKVVSNEITKRTNELAGSDKKIVNKPIYLTIHSPDVPNLTLIDLPGFTKIEMDDQNSNISNEIESLVLEYIQKENTIILAISPANYDIANSDGLQYAKKVDPNRDRTFGVMTKIDIMDKGTDACDYLSGKQYKLKHGYIGIKCRSQEDNNKGKTIKQALEEERKFFATHPAYKDFAETQGTEMLANKLSEILAEHIKKLMPNIEKLIKKNFDEYSKILGDLGSSVQCQNEYDAYEFLTKAIDQYCTKYKDLLDGNLEESFDTSYYGGSKIYQIFKYFGNKKIKTIDVLRDLTIEQILIEMRRAYGINPGLFIPEEACKSLIKKSIDAFKRPCEKCSRLVYNVLDESITLVMGDNLENRKQLRMFIHDNMEKLIEKNYNSLREFIEQRIEAEKSYINYDDDDFMLLKPYIITEKDPENETLNYLKTNFGIDYALFMKDRVYTDINAAITLSKKQNGYNSRNKYFGAYDSDEDESDNWKIEGGVNLSHGLGDDDYKNIMSMKRVIHSYFAILKKEFKASVPKYIVQFLVSKTISNMRTVLQMALTKHKDQMGLVYEDPDIKTKREIALNNIKQLKVAMKALKSVKRGRETFYEE